MPAHSEVMRLALLRTANFAIISLAAAAHSGAAPAPDLAGARAFVARIYAHYPTADSAHPWTPFGRNERFVFDASLAGLIDEDARLAHGEVGALDGDPLCDCQDDGGMSFRVAGASPDGPDGAAIDVVRRDANATPAQIEHIGVVLRRQGGVWRIHDVRSEDTPSLRAYLAEENRKRRR